MREWDGERREKEYRNWEGRNRRVIITRHIKTRGGHVLLQGYVMELNEITFDKKKLNKDQNQEQEHKQEHTYKQTPVKHYKYNLMPEALYVVY